jgi:hypothetical protein
MAKVLTDHTAATLHLGGVRPSSAMSYLHLLALIGDIQGDTT